MAEEDDGEGADGASGSQPRVGELSGTVAGLEGADGFQILAGEDACAAAWLVEAELGGRFCEGELAVMSPLDDNDDVAVELSTNGLGLSTGPPLCLFGVKAAGTLVSLGGQFRVGEDKGATSTGRSIVPGLLGDAQFFVGDVVVAVDVIGTALTGDALCCWLCCAPTATR